MHTVSHDVFKLSREFRIVKWESTVLAVIVLFRPVRLEDLPKFWIHRKFSGFFMFRQIRHRLRIWIAEIQQ